MNTSDVIILSKEEEKSLFIQYRSSNEGSLDALNKIILSMQPFLYKCASAYGKNGEQEFNDLVQAGNLALMKLIQTYDHTKGTRFLTYSYHRIKASMYKEFNTITQKVSIPAAHLAKFGRGLEYIPFEFIVSTVEIPALKDEVFNNVRLAEFIEQSSDAIEQLKPAHKKIIKDVSMGRTWTELAKEQGLTSAAIQSRYKTAIRKLRKIMNIEVDGVDG